MFTEYWKGPNSALTGASRAKSSLEIFETDRLLNDLSLSKNASPQASESDDKETTDENTKPNDTTIVAVKSVKEHAKKLNRLNTQMELSLTPQKISTPRKSIGRENKPPPVKVHIDIETFDMTNPDQTEKEWILVCSRCEYMDFNKWLSKYPYLAQKKDPFTVIFWFCSVDSETSTQLIYDYLFF